MFKHYKYCIMVANPFREFSNAINKVDWLIDGNIIKKEDVVFITYKKFSTKNIKYFKDNGLNYVKNIDKYLNIWTTRPSTLKPRKMYYYYRWRSLLKNVFFDKLITYADFSPQSQVRNRVLAEHGIKTIYYQDSSNYGGFFGEYYNAFVDTMFDQLNYDVFVAWNQEIVNFLKQYNTGIKKYVNLGVLFGERVQDIKQGRLKSTLEIDKKYKKIIGVFDSSYKDAYTGTVEDGVKFINELMWFYDENPDCFFILKEKNPRQNVDPRIRARYEVFEKLTRVKVIKEWEYSASEVIAASDLVVSFPFTTPTAEALSVGIPGLWLDTTGKFKNILYDKLGVVAYGAKDLNKKKYKLPDYFKCDKPITKLRRLICDLV